MIRIAISAEALSAAYAHLGKMEEAKAALSEARRLNPAITVEWMKDQADWTSVMRRSDVLIQ